MYFQIIYFLFLRHGFDLRFGDEMVTYCRWRSYVTSSTGIGITANSGVLPGYGLVLL
jgi:hypothetical protein